MKSEHCFLSLFCDNFLYDLFIFFRSISQSDAKAFHLLNKV